MFENLWYNNEWGYSNKTVDLIAYVHGVESGAPSGQSQGAAASVRV